jgi:hypothetical protein
LTKVAGFGKVVFSYFVRIYLLFFAVLGRSCGSSAQVGFMV